MVTVLSSRTSTTDTRSLSDLNSLQTPIISAINHHHHLSIFGSVFDCILSLHLRVKDLQFYILTQTPILRLSFKTYFSVKGLTLMASFTLDISTSLPHNTKS